MKFFWQHQDLSRALTSLDVIEKRLTQGEPELPRREMQVCARILYGMSSTGIALQLGIGEETVMTYRKRAYQRFGIACQRALLIRYLRLWNHDDPSHADVTLQ
jgi:DNA-binding NarL/FixJ family response regulator